MKTPKTLYFLRKLNAAAAATIANSNEGQRMRDKTTAVASARLENTVQNNWNKPRLFSYHSKLHLS
jgi:hypothetical protein